VRHRCGAAARRASDVQHAVRGGALKRPKRAADPAAAVPLGSLRSEVTGAGAMQHRGMIFATNVHNQAATGQ
jgi:hypothetical protein